MTTTITGKEPQRIHPHKFTMWMAMGGMIMMFAGLTSAYIVKKNQSSWLKFDLPAIFWYSTAVILLSSVTMFLSAKACKAGQLKKYKQLLSLTAVLGILFLAMQVLGFRDLHDHKIALLGPTSNSAASFLFVITFLHMLHVLGGVIGLLVISVKANRSKTTSDRMVAVEVIGSYWHFVDVLWIYLFLFYNWIG